MTTATLVDTGRAHVAHRPRSRKRRGLRWLWLPTFVVATGGLWVVLRAPARSSSPTQPVRLRAVPLGVSALGRLAPEGEVIAVVPGSVADGARVDRLLVAVGDRVTAGQVMTILDPHRRRVAAVRQAQAQVEVARAKLAQAQAGPKPDDVRVQEALIERNHAEFRAAERDLGRASFLLKKSASSRQEFDDQSLKYEQARESLTQAQAQLGAIKAIRPVDVKVAEAELAQAQAGLELAQADLEASELRSPSSGRVLRIHTRPGERVGDTGLLELGNIDVMQAVAEVYEQDVLRVHVGNVVQVRVPSVGAEMSGRVVGKDLVVGRKVIFNNDPVADTDARVVEVRIRLSPQDSLKVAGLSNARADVVIDVNGSAEQ